MGHDNGVTISPSENKVSIDVHKALGPFIALIVMNCIILGRAEAFAGQNPRRQPILGWFGLGIAIFGALFCLVSPDTSGGCLTLASWLLVFACWICQESGQGHGAGVSDCRHIVARISGIRRQGSVEE